MRSRASKGAPARNKGAELSSAQRETAEALTLLETVVSNAPFGFAFVDRDCRYVHINETLAAINGASKDIAANHICAKDMSGGRWF
jgi:hypothetical protein